MSCGLPGDLVFKPELCLGQTSDKTCRYSILPVFSRESSKVVFFLVRDTEISFT